MDCSRGGSKREVHSNIDLPHEARNFSNNLILCIKEPEKEEQVRFKFSRRRE